MRNILLVGLVVFLDIGKYIPTFFMLYFTPQQSRRFRVLPKGSTHGATWGLMAPSWGPMLIASSAAHASFNPVITGGTNPRMR